MSETEQPSLDGPAPDSPAPALHDDDLSPSVRRLVKHYDLDITGIHGTGPAGRIRVGDVMPLLGGRESIAVRDDERAEPDEERVPRSASPREVPAPSASPAPQPLRTVVFECDMSRVLARQKRAAEQGAPISVEGYIAQACGRALAGAAEVNDGTERIDVALEVDGDPARSGVLRNAANLGLNEIERSLAAERPTEGAPPTFGIRQHGASGSLLAFPLALAAHTRATLGVGRIRKVVTVKSSDDGEDTPRIGAMCYLSLSFDTGTVGDAAAHAFLASLVRTLETA
jgi:2-oxoglutarate dehydrogenase E2 component (dihydrolipoamide succinyltransferase)